MSTLKYDYSAVRHVVEALGGVMALEAVKAQVEALELPACPHCGGEAVVALTSMHTYPSAYIECRHCHNRTLRMDAAFDGFTMQPITIREAIQKAAQCWSRRVGGMAC